MRDPARIDGVLAALRVAWGENPDLRLGQLIAAAADSDDPYYIEDNDLAVRLWKMTGERQ